MDPHQKLRAVGWIYIVVGTHALIEQIVAFFLPFEFFATCVCFFPINYLMGALPVGIGLLRQSNLCRRIAVGFNWFYLVGIAVALVILVFAVLMGEVDWEPADHQVSDMVRGEDVARGISWLLFGIPLFFWQFRTLRSEEIRLLTVRTS